MTIPNLQTSQLTTKKTHIMQQTLSNLLSSLKTLTGHTSCIIALKYLNDGLTFASGSADYTIKMWNYEHGDNLKTFSGHMNDVLCLDCTATGSTLVSGSADRTVKLWSLAKKYSSACLKTLTGHTDFIWTVLVLPDSTTVCSAGLDKTIKMWDINTGSLIRNFPIEHTAHITKIMIFAKDMIVSCGYDGLVKFWDYRNGNSLHTINLETGLTAMTITSEQGILVAGYDKNIYLCD